MSLRYRDLREVLTELDELPFSEARRHGRGRKPAGGESRAPRREEVNRQ